MYLMKEERGKPIPTGLERWHSRTLSISLTLPVFHHLRQVQRAAVLWTFSTWLIWSFEQGLQKGAAYSSLGLTKVLYATSLVHIVAKAKFLRRKPSALVALEWFLKCVDPNPYYQRWLYQSILLTKLFQSFLVKGIIKENLFVMLMSSHSMAESLS